MRFELWEEWLIDSVGDDLKRRYSLFLRPSYPAPRRSPLHCHLSILASSRLHLHVFLYLAESGAHEEHIEY